MTHTPLEREVVGEARRVLASAAGPLVLAVSGGCDSMVLLHAAHRVCPERVVAVATFDHGTGPAARRAAALVRREARRLGFSVAAGRARTAGTSEAEWRRARWAFLRRVAGGHAARVVTAHTRDDHVETVLMRVLRGSGARGLAGLHAESAVVRPFLSVNRGTIRALAAVWGAAFVDDPTNDSRRYLRNRIRLELLPALRAVQPDIDAVLLELSLRAAALRQDVDAAARTVSDVSRGGVLSVAASGVSGYCRESLALLWPAMAARVGLALDRRGTERVAAFTIDGRVGGRVQVSGGWELTRMHDRFELRRHDGVAPAERAFSAGRETRYGGWRFSPGAYRADDPWTAALPAGARWVVRGWQAGDRMTAAGAAAPRRVKRFLSDARISGPRRMAWPVVVMNGEVVWIPGVRRSEAATVRPGRPAVTYACEYDDRG
ncbi:MAG TPA: tRNA lysidine(34) synthetase TilS [Gemmatimonadaceae bacterium]|nr:tRNA lysidine(34) synthetase TilS [Gemmatimonadaceae bacterium]